METHGLNHIHIQVADLDRSLRFYAVFGFQRLAGHDDLHFLFRPGHKDVLTLRVAGEGRDVDHFGFMLEDPASLDAAVAELEAVGGKLVEKFELTGNTPSAILEDPDGYRVQI